MVKKEKFLHDLDIKYNLKVLWSFLSNYKFYVFGLVVISFLLELASFFDNFVFKFLVDKGTLFSNGELESVIFAKLILYAVLVFIFVRLLSALFWYVKIEFINRLDSNVMSDVERRSFWHIINLSFRFHANKKTGSIISQFTRGVSKVESFVDAFVFNFIPVMFRLILSIGIIFYFDVATSIALAVMSILFIATGVIITNKQKIPLAIANSKEDTLKQNLSDVFLNIETIKYFGKEKRTLNYFSKLSSKLKKSRMKFWHYFSWHSAIQTTIIGAGISAVFYLSFMSFLRGELTMGSVTLIYAAVWKLIPVLFGLIHGYREFIRSSVDVEALFAMFKEENEVKDLSRAKRLQVKRGVINLKDIYFAYPKSDKTGSAPKNILKDFNLKIKKNTKVALVGPSGSGKTTVIKLLYRLFDLDEGTISIDGQDISKVTQESLRNSMSIVPQEPLLFDNTLYFNIAYANPTATRKEVLKAIKFAQLDKFIKYLPRREKTYVGERGVKLSGGEKQRVSIARALLANKKILILDEATSALDSETEREIQKSLDELMKGRTSIIIAHRLSTIMKADVIVVMNKGKIVEVGTHKELKKQRGGLYQRLWKLQQGGLL